MSRKMQLCGTALEVAESYRETLSELTFNNKLVINTLTEIANENNAFARDIVDEIEKRIYQVTADQMLPLMYLTDSICKNLGSPYQELFQERLVANFSYIFLHVSEEVRSSLYEFRSTWGDKFQVFSDVMLCELDKKVKKIDPAWPVSEPKVPDHQYGETSISRTKGSRFASFKEIKENLETSFDINGKSGPDNITPLMCAVLKKDYPEMRRLLDQPGIHLECQNKYGQTTLHLACQGIPSGLQQGAETDKDSDSEAVRILLLNYHNKDILKIKDMWNQTALQAAIGSRNYSEIMKGLQDANKIKRKQKLWRETDKEDDDKDDDKDKNDDTDNEKKDKQKIQKNGQLDDLMMNEMKFLKVNSENDDVNDKDTNVLRRDEQKCDALQGEGAFGPFVKKSYNF